MTLAAGSVSQATVFSVTYYGTVAGGGRTIGVNNNDAGSLKFTFDDALGTTTKTSNYISLYGGSSFSTTNPLLSVLFASGAYSSSFFSGNSAQIDVEKGSVRVDAVNGAEGYSAHAGDLVMGPFFPTNSFDTFDVTLPSATSAYYHLNNTTVELSVKRIVLTSDVPEPATWAMFIGGFGMIGGAMRRRQRVNVSFA